MCIRDSCHFGLESVLSGEIRRMGGEQITVADGKVSFTGPECMIAVSYTHLVEGIIPAIESSHAIAYTLKFAPTLSKDQTIVVSLSGRGDKDVNEVARLLEENVYDL